VDSARCTLAGSPLRRLQELAASVTWLVISGWRATKDPNLAGCLSECDQPLEVSWN
jgi:hypothetical protein